MYLYTHTQLTLEQHRSLGAPLCSLKPAYNSITYSRPSVYRVPPYPWFCIRKSNQTHHVFVLTIEKPHV